MKVPEELKNRYREGRLIPFIGAGVSMSVEWKKNRKKVTGPSWKELVDTAAELLGACEPDLLRVRGTDLQILEYFDKKKGGLDELTNWLVKNLDPPNESLKNASIHQELVKLDRCKTFYTTNFDFFLEKSFQLNGRATHVIAKEGDIIDYGDKTTIVKFHGDLNNLKRMVLSESDYQNRLSFQSPMDFKFRSDLLGKAILFLGYSFRDENVSYLFHLINKKLGDLPNSPDGRRAYITVPDPSDFEKRLFHDRNIDVIPIRGSKMTEEIVNLLQELRS